MKITFGDDATESLSNMLEAWEDYTIRVRGTKSDVIESGKLEDFRLMHVGHDMLVGGVLGIRIWPVNEHGELDGPAYYDIEVTDELEIHVY